MRARLMTGPLAVALGVVAVAAPAGAESRNGSEAFINEDDNPTVVVTVGQDRGGAGGNVGSEPCVWEVVITDDLVSVVYDVDGTTRHSATGRWLQKVCPGLGAVEVGGAYLVPEGGQVDVEALADEARASIGVEAPTIRTSPDASGRLIVHVPTWLWVDGGWWHGYKATASTGRVSATVTARPTRTSWSVGDGTDLTCSGPGTAWHPGMVEDATDCSHTYTASSATSPDGMFDLSVTVELEVAWTSSVGEGGTLAPISRSASRSVEVGEIQAVGTAG